eukprot:scaffold753_cov390-Pavlova_lutheri.AAC.1
MRKNTSRVVAPGAMKRMFNRLAKTPKKGSNLVNSPSQPGRAHPEDKRSRTNQAQIRILLVESPKKSPRTHASPKWRWGGRGNDVPPQTTAVQFRNRSQSPWVVVLKEGCPESERISCKVGLRGWTVSMRLPAHVRPKANTTDG